MTQKLLDLAETLRGKVREVKAFETVLVEMASARITIDLDDGVKANYPKFYPLVEPIKGLESSDDDEPHTTRKGGNVPPEIVVGNNR